ncbi:uncharacterized protein SAPINGB_P004211 [Magnusiomyces paraingens]|uniref:Uncharacterized protein n=1 Tax=Magnusiomyces paraingens TaxID=2606893 RepID=A0A5E8BYR2_9ASCO|nr:uncharacterized protein SAPINGB_P004211 [Saprochaete ingens]VVT54707.1 unnamed protein product [Saprochaete ingens]
MGRKAEQLYQAGTAPPETLDVGEFVAQVLRPRGNSAYDVSVPESTTAMVRQLLRIPEKYAEDQPLTLIVDMPPKFRNTLFVKRGGYVLVGLKDDLELVYPGAAVEREKEDQQQQQPQEQLPDPELEQVTEVKEEATKKPAKSKKPRGKQPNPLKQQLKLHGTLKPKPTSGTTTPGTSASSASKPKTHETIAVGEIVAVVMRGAREWHKRAWWPVEY